MAYYKASQDPTKDIRERLYVPELLKGLGITARHFFRNLFGTRDTNLEVVDRKGTSLVSTVQYPEEKPIYPEGYRGLHRLVPREDGKPRCVACYMCATICPAQCIYIEAGEYDSASPEAESRVIEAGERIRAEAARIVVPGTDGLTVSVGLAVVRPDQQVELHKVIEQADRALYEAKQGGRNATALSLVGEAG